MGEDNAAVFEVHKMMMDDYLESILEIMREQEVNAEYAVAVTGTILYYGYSHNKIHFSTI